VAAVEGLAEVFGELALGTAVEAVDALFLAPVDVGGEDGLGRLWQLQRVGWFGVAHGDQRGRCAVVLAVG